MKIIITETQLKNLVSILKEDDDDMYYKISADDYKELMVTSSFHPRSTYIRKFRGKPLYIIGDLDLRDLPISTLGNVKYIDGNLNIDRTEISSLKGIDVRGHISDWETPIEARRIREAELVKEAEADGRRENNDWGLDNPNIDEEGLAANALFNQLVSDGGLNEMDEETKDEIKSKMEQYEEIEERYSRIKDTASEEELERLENESIELRNEIEELKEQGADVYYIIPENYKPYGNLHSFNIVGKRGVEYMVGLYENMYDAAVQNQEDLLDDVGVEGLSSWLIEDNLDKEQIRSEMEEYYEDDIRESPESYFDSDDYELTDEQEERKEQLEEYLEKLGKHLIDLEERYKNLDLFSGSARNQIVIDKLKKEIEQIEENIETAQDEFDSIEPDTEPTDEMIEKKVKYYIRTTDEVDWLKEHGYDLKDYVDMNGVAKDIVDSDGIGVISSYDGRYDNVYITGLNGVRYNFVIVRTN
jgi:predicted  nucleic acid-binding Zn-ribbon protein